MNSNLDSRKWNGLGVYGHECLCQTLAGAVNGTMFTRWCGRTVNRFSDFAFVESPVRYFPRRQSGADSIKSADGLRVLDS
jgi:hypothetical protein